MIKIIMDLWNNSTDNFMQYAIDAYSAIDPWFYPILLFGIVGYVYTYMRSTIAAVVAIFITLGIYGATGIFNGTYELTLFMYIVALVGVVALIVTFVQSKQKGW